MTPLQAAEYYHDRGMSPVPVQDKGKRPMLKDWPGLANLPKSDLSKYFNGGPSNVGVILGDKYGTADVDLDCQEAIYTASILLEETGMVFGRPSKPFSNYIYRCAPAVRSKRYMDPVEPNKDKACLVELRCLKSDGTIGMQTVFPPSIHESGEQIRFMKGCDKAPANIDAATLQTAVARVAAASIFARHLPGEGSGRNAAFIALAGVLARSGWPLDQAVAFHRAIYRALWQNHADMEAAKAEVAATYEKHARGLDTTGRPKLEGLIDKRVVATAFDWLGISNYRGVYGVEPAPTEGPGGAGEEQHQVRAEAAGEWPKPEPMLDELPPVLPFCEEILPDSFRPLAVDVSERMQVPLDYPAVMGILGLAGAVSRRATIQPMAHDTSWVVVPKLMGRSCCAARLHEVARHSGGNPSPP